MFGFVFVDFQRKFDFDRGQVHFLLGRSCGLDPQRHSKRHLKNMIINKRQEYKKNSGLQIGEGNSEFFVLSTCFKVIPQKKKFLINFFETFPECSPPSIVSKKKIKMIGHRFRLRVMMGQSYSIYACSRANHGHYSSVHVKFCSSSKHTLLK